MKNYSKLFVTKAAVICAVIIVAIVTLTSPAPVSAQCSGGMVYQPGTGCVSPTPPPDTADEEPRARANSTCNTIPVRAEDCPLLADYVIPFINALSGAVGIVIVIMVAWGGLQYTTSRDNPQQSAQAKEHIRNALFALVFYIFIVAFLNWVVPGGVF